MKKAYLAVTFIILLVLLTGCGPKSVTKNESTPSNKTAANNKKAALTIKDMAGRTVHFRKIPKRIITLTNSDMNIIYSLGGKVVGRQTQDASGVKPQAAKKAAEVGNTHNLNLEKITALAPDVVIASAEQNVKDVPALESLGTKVILTGANSVAEVKQQITVLGKLIDKSQAAKQLNNKLTKKEQQVIKAQKDKRVRALLILGAPGSNYAALPNSLSGDILAKSGGINVAKDLKGVENFPQYAALNTEKIVTSNPEVIFLMIHGGDAKETETALKKEMRQNDAWKATAAVKNNHIVVLPPDLFGTNPGVRISEALDIMAKEINKVHS